MGVRADIGGFEANGVRFDAVDKVFCVSGVRCGAVTDGVRVFGICLAE